jgi:hypothetical protein
MIPNGSVAIIAALQTVLSVPKTALRLSVLAINVTMVISKTSTVTAKVVVVLISTLIRICPHASLAQQDNSITLPLVAVKLVHIHANLVALLEANWLASRALEISSLIIKDRCVGVSAHLMLHSTTKH